MSDIHIRAYIAQDRIAVRRISCETAFLEDDRNLFFDDDDILADALTLYYSDYEPESCFVAVSDDKVVGYIIGSKDVIVAGKIFLRRILMPLFLKALRRGLFIKRNALWLLWHVTVSALKGEFYAPDFSKQYPATLHINIDMNFRGQKIGARLIQQYLDYLKKKKVIGVHFGTMSDSGKAFFLKLGFRLLYESKRSYLKYRTGKILPLHIMGKKLL